MTRTLLATALGALLGAGGLALARQQHAEPRVGDPRVTVVSERDVVETLDGKPARVTVLDVVYGPGGVGKPHRHAGPIFGYILEGEFEIGLGQEPAKTLKAGETFYEPGGILHRVGRNPSDKTPARILAVMLHARDAGPLTVPDAKD